MHLEWTPDGVRAVNIATHQSADAAHLSALGPILDGAERPLIGIGRRAVFLKSLRLPKADREDLRRILSVQMGQIFPLPAELLAFDFVQTDDLSPEGCLTVVGAMRGDDLRRLHAELKAAGLTAGRILPVCLAAPAVAASAGRSDALVAEAGPAELALDVVRGGTVVLSRVVPGRADAAGEAARTLAAAGAALPVVSAGEGGLPSLADALPGLGTSLSLLHEAPPFAFELAEDQARESRARAGERTRLAALLCAAAALLVGLVWADRAAALAAAKRQQGVRARQLTRLRSIREADALDFQKAQAAQEVVDRAFHPGQPLGDGAAAAADLLPATTWLSGLSAERGKPMQIRGTTTTPGDVPRVVAALGRSSRFRDVHLVFANSVTVGKARVVEFDISAVCAGNPPLLEPDKTNESAATESAAGGSE